MPRTFTPSTGIETTARRLAMSVNAAVGTLDHGTARFTSASNDTTVWSDSCAAACSLAMCIDISIRTLDHRATRFASAGSRAVGTNHSTALAKRAMRDGSTVWSLGDVTRRTCLASGGPDVLLAPDL